MSKKGANKRKIPIQNHSDIKIKAMIKESFRSDEDDETSGMLNIMKTPFFEINCEELSKALLGKILVKRIDCSTCLEGKIVETEAYIGGPDKASHSFNGIHSSLKLFNYNTKHKIF